MLINSGQLKTNINRWKKVKNKSKVFAELLWFFLWLCSFAIRMQQVFYICRPWNTRDLFSRNQDPLIVTKYRKHKKTIQSGEYPILRNWQPKIILPFIHIHSEEGSHQIPSTKSISHTLLCTMHIQSKDPVILFVDCKLLVADFSCTTARGLWPSCHAH